MVCVVCGVCGVAYVVWECVHVCGEWYVGVSVDMCCGVCMGVCGASVCTGAL